MTLTIIAPKAIDPNEYLDLDCMTKLVSKCSVPHPRCIGVSGSHNPIDWISLCKSESILYWPFAEAPSNDLLVEMLRAAAKLRSEFTSIGYHGYNYDKKFNESLPEHGHAKAVDCIQGALLLNARSAGTIAARNYRSSRSAESVSLWLSMVASVRFRLPARIVAIDGPKLASIPSVEVYQECKLYGWKRYFKKSPELLNGLS